MDKYTIFCTETQTKKALKLGAPIRINKNGIFDNPITIIGYPYLEKVDNHGNEFTIPTAEWMINWLEEQENIWKINVDRCPVLQWYYAINSEPSMSIRSNNLYSSRKEATIAAIDAALEYLSINKK